MQLSREKLGLELSRPLIYVSSTFV
jgi:hypothetical protein